MPELPPGMLRNPDGKRDLPIEPYFHPDEYLYRRVPDWLWDDGESPPFDIDAIALPDMSVGRSKLAHPEWLRLRADQFALCAVVGFRWGDVPRQMFESGILFVFDAVHTPESRDYPHSEVRAYRENRDRQRQHVTKTEDLPESLYLEWREEMHRLATRGIFLRSGQPKPVRTHSPKSYKPEDIPESCV
jgi:hypothetical protein